MLAAGKPPCSWADDMLQLAAQNAANLEGELHKLTEAKAVLLLQCPSWKTET